MLLNCGRAYCCTRTAYCQNCYQILSERPAYTVVVVVVVVVVVNAQGRFLEFSKNTNKPYGIPSLNAPAPKKNAGDAQKRQERPGLRV